MTTQKKIDTSRKPMNFLWLTFDFASCLPTSIDNITPTLFLTLMAHPAINQIKRFTTQADNLGPDDVAQWEPGIFTVQTYRSSLADVLTQVASSLAPHLASEPTSEQPAITIYTQLDGRHYPVETGLSPSDIQQTAIDIEAMVNSHEKT